MPENLANTSTILLFGREVSDIQVVAPGGSGAPPPAGPSHFLAAQIAAPGGRLARVYAFAYEGNYYELSRPALFLVHGQGQSVTETVELSGLAATSRNFATDVLVWPYDKSDLSVRLDVETGTLEQILLEAELIGDRARATLSGQNVRFSGQNARFAGQNARLRGSRGDGNSDS